MKNYTKELTLELLKKHNKIFFDNAGFHGDKGYLIFSNNDGNFLQVKTKLTGIVYYKINPDNYKLTYVKL